MVDQPQAQVLVLRADQARLGADRVVLPGGAAADVFEDEDGDQLVSVSGGRVRPDELLRGVLRTPGLGVHHDVLDLVVVTDQGWDRQLLTADLRTRLLHTRHHEQRTGAGGRHVAVLGPPPGDPMEASAPSAAATAVARLAGRASRPVGRLTELPLVADPRWTDAAGRRDQVLAEVDLVVASWGVLGPDHDLAVDDARDALRRVRDRGGGVLVRSRGDPPDAVGADGHPAARDDVGPDDGLAAAPADWLWGAPLG